MMALSDAELRKELEKYGVNVGPVTDSTRKVLLKRLEKLQKDGNIKQTTRINSGSAKIKKGSTKAPEKRERSSSPVLRSLRNSRSSRSQVQSAIGYSTDENEDEKVSRRTSKVNDSTPSTRSTRQGTRRSYASSREYEAKTLTPVHRRIKDLANNRKSSSMSPKRKSTGSIPTTEKYSDDSDDESDRSSMDSWVAIESTETNTTPSLLHTPTREPIRVARQNKDRLEKIKAEIEAWKREEEKNLNKLTQRNVGGRFTATDQNELPNTHRKAYGNGVPNIVTQALRNKHNAGLFSADDGDEDAVQTQPWTVNFSSFLPIGTCIFFVVLGLLYATMKYDPSLSSRPAIDNKSTEKSGNEWRVIASMIWDHVGTFAGERECGTSSATKDYLPITEVLLDLSIKDGRRNTSFIQASKTLIETPEWGIQFYDINEVIIEDPDSQDKARFIGSIQPLLSGWCRFTRALQKVLFRIILTIAVGILIWLGLVYRRYRIEKQREEREQMYTMVQKILEVLRKQYDLSENNDGIQPFLPIVHVRDMIVPPKDRKKMAKVWERAKQFLSASETRIRVETQRISGEDYLVWRWIQAASPAKRHTPTSRIWQGEAFDIRAINRPMICPTPCLKIRNMFDPDMEVSQNWIQQIQDSILEKCQGNNEILRICIEKESNEGLVYMLCASNQGAGRAFQALHGAWFDGRLVTVKFIRLHRFHHRFPDSVNQSKTPMRPTSDVPVSTIINPTSPGTDATYEKLYPTLPDD